MKIVKKIIFLLVCLNISLSVVAAQRGLLSKLWRMRDCKPCAGVLGGSTARANDGRLHVYVRTKEPSLASELLPYLEKVSGKQCNYSNKKKSRTHEYACK